jgi:hypothetical protein
MKRSTSLTFHHQDLLDRTSYEKDENKLLFYKMQGRINSVVPVEINESAGEWSRQQYFKDIASRYRQMTLLARKDRQRLEAGEIISPREQRTRQYSNPLSGGSLSSNTKTTTNNNNNNNGDQVLLSPKSLSPSSVGSVSFDEDITSSEDDEFKSKFLQRTNVGLIYFKRFLENEHSKENLTFYLEAERFREDLSRLHHLASDIFNRFVASPPPALQKIISQNEKQLIEKDLQIPMIDILRPTRIALYKLMKHDAFIRFLKSDEYQSYLKQDK